MINFRFGSEHNWHADLQILRDFAFEWHGLPSRHKQTRSHIEFSVSVPLVLRTFYEEYWSDRDKLVAFNDLVAPNELVWYEQRLVFYRETEHVYEWAVADATENPPVVGRFCDGGCAWVEEHEKLCRFLLQMCIFEAVMGAPFGASVAWYPADELKRLLAAWVPVGFGPWQWPAHPTWFYYRPDALAAVTPNGDGFSFKCGAKTAGALDALADFVGPDWQYVRMS